MENLPDTLRNEIQKLDETILFETQELQKLKFQADAMRAEFLTVQMENKVLYKKIAFEEQTFREYVSARTRDQLDVLKKEMDHLSDMAERTWENYQSGQQEERHLTLFWQKVLHDLPKEWFYQDDVSIGKMIEEITSKIDKANAEVDHEKEENELGKKQLVNEAEERQKRNQKLELFIRELKRTIIGLKLIK